MTGASSAGLRASGWRTQTVDLGDGFPLPGAEARTMARARLAALPADRPIVVDGLALGAMPEAAMALCASHRLIGLVHHPLALETGLSRRDAAALRVQRAPGARLRAAGDRHQRQHARG